jgi:hypothetical protein
VEQAGFAVDIEADQADLVAKELMGLLNDCIENRSEGLFGLALTPSAKQLLA